MKFLKSASAAMIVVAASAMPALADGVVNIYSLRQPELIAPVLDLFTEKTGIETRVLNLNEGVLERLKAEGRNSPADVILTTDIGNLVALAEGDVTQAVDDATISNNIPSQYRDPAGQWFGLTVRGRVIYASVDRVAENALDYEDLASDAFAGRVCTRSGQHPYNVALFASLVAHHGEEAARDYLANLKANLARVPSGNDRAQAQGIYSGECDVALGNTYYVGLMMTNETNPEQKDWAAAIKVIFPNADGRGTHVNLSGMAMAKNAPNRENALELMRFLTSIDAQEIYAEQVFEYPVVDGAEPSDLVKSFGELNADPLPLSEIAAYRALASQLVDQVGYDG